MAFQRTLYRVIGASDKGDEKVVEKYGLKEAKTAANDMLASGLTVRLIKEVASIHGVRKPGERPF